MTGDFRRIVSTIAHLPAAACTTSAPGSKSPLGRGGGAAQRALGVLPGFPVVGGRLCAPSGGGWGGGGGQRLTIPNGIGPLLVRRRRGCQLGGWRRCRQR